MNSQHRALVALQRQQAADRAQAAKAKADAAAAKAKADAAAAKAKADAAAAKVKAQAEARIAKAEQDAAAAKTEAQAAHAAAARAEGIRRYYTGYVASNANVWGYFPLTSAVKNSVYVRVSPNRADGIVGQIYVGSSVGVICSVRGETVTDSLGSSDIWDYVTYPAAGYVSDEFVNEGGSVAPSCY
jgi:ATPase subunit of ABC transporter with duplicated ATPase domains